MRAFGRLSISNNHYHPYRRSSDCDSDEKQRRFLKALGLVTEQEFEQIQQKQEHQQTSTKTRPQRSKNIPNHKYTPIQEDLGKSKVHKVSASATMRRQKNADHHQSDDETHKYPPRTRKNDKVQEDQSQNWKVAAGKTTAENTVATDVSAEA